MIPWSTTIRHVGLYVCKFQCYHQHRAFFCGYSRLLQYRNKTRSSAIRRECASNVATLNGAICRINTKKHQVRHVGWRNKTVERFRPVFNTLVLGEPLNMQRSTKFGLKKLEKRAIVRCRHIYIRLFRFVRLHAFDRQTDRQMSIARCDLTKLDVHKN